MPYKSPKDKSEYVSLRQLVGMFYTSRFNRDDFHPIEDGEDIDNSRRYRVYNKGDVEELMKVFSDFFAWALLNKNIGKIYITDDITLVRKSRLPMLKKANVVDAALTDRAVAGKYYITKGRYHWELEIKGQFLKDVVVAQDNDPYFNKLTEELIPEMEKRNAEL